MTALTKHMAYLKNIYDYDSRSYDVALGQQFITALATAPEFMLR